MKKISKDDIEDYIIENEQWKEGDIICPYCKHKHENEDSEFLYTEKDNYEFECEKCDAYDKKHETCLALYYCHKLLKRPPQSWCYVEELEEE